MDNAYIQRLVQISKMYYEQGMTQESIAKIFGISRSVISVELTEAKNNGIVSISIKDPSCNNDELAGRLADRFSLRKCVVVPSGTHNEQTLLKIVASQADNYAAGLFKSHSSIGVAWGKTLAEFMGGFPTETALCDISVVPLVGASPLLTSEFQLNENVRQFAEKLRGYPVFIYSPGFCDTVEDRESIERSSYMKPIQDLWHHLDYAVIGVGRIKEDGEAKKPRKGVKSLVEELKRCPDTAVGDICARKINIHGEFIDNEFNRKLIAISSEELRNTSNVLAVAVGSSKVIPAIGALRTGIVHYFVTDENTAEQILNLADSGNLPD